MIRVIPAKNPYKPKHGDLVCGFNKPSAEGYIETPTNELPEGQVMPLCLIDHHCWQASKRLDIDAAPIYAPYKCPYTKYEFFSIIPVALISTDLSGKWRKTVVERRAGVDPDYVLDHEFNRHMWKDTVFDIQDIGKLMLGSGYTSMTSIYDGSRSMHRSKVNLDNGDTLWVYFWEWHNK